MKLLAENRFAVTKKLFYEGMMQVTKESYGSFIKKVLLFLVLVSVILAVVTLMGGGSLLYAVPEFAVAVLIGAWLTVLMPRSKARRAWAALENRNGGNLERITRFYPSYLEADNGSEEITVLYEDIRKILQSEHLLVLLSVEEVGILVVRDGFLSGDLAVVQTLIEGKMSKAQ